MATVVRVDPADARARLESELERLLARLDVVTGIEQVWLIGSLLHGRIGATSDIDLVVVRRTSRPPGERGVELASQLAPRTGLDLFVYTPEEFERGSRFVAHVRRHGKRIR